MYSNNLCFIYNIEKSFLYCTFGPFACPSDAPLLLSVRISCNAERPYYAVSQTSVYVRRALNHQHKHSQSCSPAMPTHSLSSHSLAFFLSLRGAGALRGMLGKGTGHICKRVRFRETLPVWSGIRHRGRCSGLGSTSWPPSLRSAQPNLTHTHTHTPVSSSAVAKRTP